MGKYFRENTNQNYYCNKLPTALNYGKEKEAYPAQGLEPSPQLSVQETKARNLHCVLIHCLPPHPPQRLPHRVHPLFLLLHLLYHQLKMPSAILAMATVALKSGLSAGA